MGLHTPDAIAKLVAIKGTMKTAREIILELKVLQASSQTLEPKVVLEHLLNLAEAVAREQLIFVAQAMIGAAQIVVVGHSLAKA